MLSRDHLKHGFTAIAPRTALTVKSIRSRMLQEAQAKDLNLTKLARKVAEATNMACASGPFRGMKFPPSIIKAHGSPKLLGTYECELHPAIEAMITRGVSNIVNVGCAEGYYAVGLALRLAEARVSAYDSDPIARFRVRALALLNGCSDRISARGIVDHNSLNSAMGHPGSLLIMDCEGAEADLLEPSRSPSLRTAAIIVEIHCNRTPGLDQILCERFRRTHHCELVLPESRSRLMRPATTPSLSDDEWQIAVDERRGYTPWGVFYPR